MGTFAVPVEISRPYGNDFAAMDALVDTGATYSVFPSDILESVGAVADETRIFELADSNTVELPLGQAAIRVAGKQVIIYVVFGPPGCSSLLGATTLEVAGFAADPIRKILIPVNSLLLMGFNGNSGNGLANNDIP